MTPQTLASEVHRLFTLPDVAIRLHQLLGKDAVTTPELAEIVALDPALSATLLKLANSAYYGLSRRVETLAQAINVVGHTALINLSTAISVLNTFTGLPREVVDMTRFWEHSMTCASLSRLLARQAHHANAETLFVAGLLHGVGRLVFYLRRPEQYRAVLAAPEPGYRAIAARERDVFGFDYAELGAALLEAWRLPESLREPVRYQLRPGDAPTFRREAALLALANDIAERIAPDQALAEPTAAVDAGVAMLAGVELDAATLTELIQAANLEALEFLDILRPEATIIR